MVTRVTRPKAVVLPDSALVPEHFTHEVVTRQPYYRADPMGAAPPDGHFAAGTRLRLLASEPGPMSRVAAADGAVVFTANAGLRALAGR